MSFLNRVRRIATYRFWISEIILKLIFPFLQRLFWLCSEVNSLRCCCFEHTSNKFVAKQIHDSDIIGDAGNHIDLYLCLQRVLNVFLASKCKCREVEGESVARKVKKKEKYTKTTIINNYSTGRRQPDEVINKRRTRPNIFSGLFTQHYHMCIIIKISIFHFLITSFHEYCNTATPQQEKCSALHRFFSAVNREMIFLKVLNRS